MVNDVYEFIKKKNIKKFSIIGHSMGGKLGMLFTLLYPQFVKQLFVVDIAPVDYPREEIEVVDHLLKIDVKNCKSRKDVDEKLSNYINDKELRSFLLQNLNFKENHLTKEKNNFYFGDCDISKLFLYKSYSNLIFHYSNEKNIEGVIDNYERSKSISNICKDELTNKILEIENAYRFYYYQIDNANGYKLKVN